MTFGFNSIFQRMRNSTADVSKQFDNALTQSTKKTPAPAKQPVTPPPHQWNENPAGISQFRVEPGMWPLRIFEKAGVDPQDNEAMQGQLASTPSLDPQAFGNRPAAAPDAANHLNTSDGVNVLSPERLALLETQRDALKIASDPAKSQTEKDKAKDDLVVAIAQEIDLSSVGQGAPELGVDKDGDKKVDAREASDLVQPILDRAPNDPVFLDAFNQARELTESKWKADGRTDDQLGIIASAGDGGDYKQVAAETKKQLVDLALAAGPSEAAQITALSYRANIYANFGAGDTAQYASAVQAGAEQAIKEIRVDRKVAELTKAFGKGDIEGAQAFLAKLREKTDVENTLPGSGSLLSSDPKVLEMIDKSIDAISGSGPRDGDMKAKTQALVDLGLASQNILYNDGATPGKGKDVVDHIAKYVVDRMRTDLPGGPTNVFDQQKFFSIVSREDLQGGGTSLLTAVAAHTAVEGEKEKGNGKYESDGYLALNSNAQWAMRRSIENFGAASRSQDEKIDTLYNELYHGLSGWGSNVKSDTGVPTAVQFARDMEAIDAMSPENKKKSEDLVSEGNERQKLWERQESIELAVDMYADANKKVEGQDSEAPIPMLFGTGIMLTKSKSIKEALEGLPERPQQSDDPYQDAATDPKTPGTIWVQRATRALATFAVTETLKGSVKDINVALGENRYQSILQGNAVATKAEVDAIRKADKLSPTTAAYIRNAKAALGEARFNEILEGRTPPTNAEKSKVASIGHLNFGLNAVTRLSGGVSAGLFGRNLDALGGTPDDLVYYIPHTMMMLSAAQTAVLPQAKQVLPDAAVQNGNSTTPDVNGKTANVLERVEADKTLTKEEKSLWQKTLNGAKSVKGGGVDSLYVAADMTNALMNGFGLAGTKQDGVKAWGYGTATLSDAMFAAVASKGTEAALLKATPMSNLMKALGPLKVSGVAAVLQVVGAGIVGGRGAYNAAHTYDKADADAIQVLYGVKDRKTAEMLAEHNDLLDEGLMGILQTVFPGDEHLMGGDELTRSADNVLTDTYGSLDYNRARLGQLFNSWTPEQAKEVSEKIRDMTAKSDGKLADTQDDLKYLQLPTDPAKVDISNYPTIKYNDAEKRFEDSTTTMYWDGHLWRMPSKKVTYPVVPGQDPLWYNPAEGTLMLENAFAKQVKPNSKEGLKAWLKNMGYAH